MGRVVSSGPYADGSGDEFVRICLALQEKGAENINIVTGSHAVPALVSGIHAARERGLSIPVLWNSSAYESLDALSLLRDTVDVYLPDLKTLDADIARRFFKAPDYPETAEAAILRMLEYRGTMQFGPPRSGGATADGDEKASASGVQEAAGDGQVLLSGVIIRHLVLPGYLDATREVIRWFADHAQGRALLSLMTQYTPVEPHGGILPGSMDCNPTDPVGSPGTAAFSPTAPTARYINQQEYETLLRWLEEFGIEDGFYQELVPDNDWLPDFNRVNPFSSALSLPVWHWKAGFTD
ncbi:hypothetical protein FACS1894130_07710 [Spirochaetia bacterium]|nr:hypothetical protein FACS1894130_07710 [Spirochaetia bacterium]